MTNTSENGQPFEAEFPAEGRLLGLEIGRAHV